MSNFDLTEEERQHLCVACQACCKKLSFNITPVPAITEFYRARGLRVKTYKVQNTFVAWLDIPHVCQHLTPLGCAIYKKRPLACMHFDGSKHPSTKGECFWNKEDKVCQVRKMLQEKASS